MNRCGFGPCGGRFAGGGGTSWPAVMDSIAFWILAVVAVLFLLGLRRRSRGWGRGPQGRGGFHPGRGGAQPGGWPGWGPAGFVPPHLAQAEATLAERFSRGEITAEQYHAGIAALRGQSQPPAQPQAPQYPQYPPTGPAAPAQPEPPQAPPAPTDPVD